MATERTPDMFGFEAVEGRAVVAAFDGGAITSDAGALLLGATDRVIRMVDRLASCFVDRRSQAQVEHSVATLVGQRIIGIALGYEDLNDHETLRHDPLMAVLAGKLEARRADCAAVAGKSTLNRLELSKPEPSRYHKISYDAAAMDKLFVDLFLEAHRTAPREITLDLDATDDPLHGEQEGRFFHGYYKSYSVSASAESSSRWPRPFPTPMSFEQPGPRLTARLSEPSAHRRDIELMTMNDSNQPPQRMLK
jgi:hypothetical protein